MPKPDPTTSARNTLIAMATDADGNADVLIRSLMLYGRQNGHQGIYLGMLLREEDELIAAGILDPIDAEASS